MQDFMINVTGATRGRMPLGGIPQIGSYVRLHEKRWRVLDVEVDLDAAPAPCRTTA